MKFFQKSQIPIISIITWDASFRESYHTIHSLSEQEFDPKKYEILWIEFYENQSPALLSLSRIVPNLRIITLRNSPSVPWHLGVCMNRGISEAKGEILILCDGDIIVPANFLQTVSEEHAQNQRLALYFRRWDEPEEFHRDAQSYTIGHLAQVSVLYNPTNYAGALSIRKNNIMAVGGYEESEVFAGPGVNGMELYLRIRNLGFSVAWHKERIFHPFHSNTGSYSHDLQHMVNLAKEHPWIKPYAGIEQSWVVKCRDTDISCMANNGDVERYLQALLDINLDNSSELSKNELADIFILAQSLSNNNCLKSKDEVAASEKLVRLLGLPEHTDRQKNWDTLKAVQSIVCSSSTSAKVLDAGGGLYSPVLNALVKMGYRDLYACDVVDVNDHTQSYNSLIKFSIQNIEDTDYSQDSFDVVTSLSVIEHGVDLRKFFQEMSRILKSNGLLLITMDFWPEAISCFGIYPYGPDRAEMKIFDAHDVEEIIAVAGEHDFYLSSPIDLAVDQKAVRWEQVDREYTFLFLSFRKRSGDFRQNEH